MLQKPYRRGVLGSLAFLALMACENPVSTLGDGPNPIIGDTTSTPTIVNKIDIDTDIIDGELYNFWSTRPMINQTRFSSSGFTDGLDGIKPYVKSYNLVRVLGGRTDSNNQFFKGVDADGKIIVDFSQLITNMKDFMETGFKPRIVLDNVPWEMVEIQEMNTYGNTNPPDSYDVWRQYINAFLNTLIDEFSYNEVKTWRFRVATEPNYCPQHWNGDMDSFFKHYDITVDEVLKVIPEAIIGPGNLLTESGATFTTDIIDHCAIGTNYVTGEKGTRMSFLCLSYYEKIDHGTVLFPEVIHPYRIKLNSYPEFSSTPLDIQEFGVLRDENAKRGLSLSDATEFGASWYATIADLAYEYNVNEIYDWGQESTDDLATGRRHVTSMLLKMENGQRLAVDHSLDDFQGVIPVLKDGKTYLLIYNHIPTRESDKTLTVTPAISGSFVDGVSSFEMNEWTVDKDHGIFMHELYDDVFAAGVANKTTSSARIYGNRPDDYFEDGWEAVFDANKSKYEELSKFSQTVQDSIVSVGDEGSLILNVQLEPHSVKLVELIPQ